MTEVAAVRKVHEGLIARTSGAGRATPRVSFEFFPPKTEEMEDNLWAAVARLAPLAPSFVSVTYGAGGSTRERTHRTVRRMLDETQLKPAAHLTCVDASRAEVDEVISAYWETGVRHIVALRGDPPGVGGVGGVYVPSEGSYNNATELTAAIRRIGDFEVSVGCYPEGHPEGNLDKDIDVLKAKMDAGATRAISQFFFDIDAFLRFVDKARAAGVTIPILPGVMPVTNFKGLLKMAAPVGISIPTWLGALFEGLDSDPDTRRLIACAVAAELCANLQAEGFEDFHFYTLNRADLTYALCRVLGVRAQDAAA